MAALNYLDEAKELWGISHTEGTKHDAQLAIGAALVAIAEELQSIHEIMQWSDANARRVTEERAASMAPSFEEMQRWEKEDDDAHELPY